MARQKGFEAEGMLGDVVQALTEGIQNAGPIPVNVDLVINTGQLEAAIRQVDAFMARMKITPNMPLPGAAAPGKPSQEQSVAPKTGRDRNPDGQFVSKDASERFLQAVQKFEVQVKSLGESAKALAAAAAAPAQSPLNSELLVAIKALAKGGIGGGGGQTTFLTDEGVVASSPRPKKPAPATTVAEDPAVATMRAELTARIAELSRKPKAAGAAIDNEPLDAAIAKINKLFDELGDLSERSTVATRTLRGLSETLKDLQIDFEPLSPEQKTPTVRKNDQLLSQIDAARGDFTAIKAERAKQLAAGARTRANQEEVAKELDGLKRQLAELNATVSTGSDKIGTAIDAAVKELQALDLGSLDETKLEQGINKFLRQLESSGASLEAIGAVNSLVRSKFQGTRMGSSASAFDPATSFVVNTNDTSYDAEGTLTPSEIASAKARREAKSGPAKKVKKPGVQESEALLDTMAAAELDDIMDISEAKEAIRETLKNAETFKKRLLEFLSIGDTLAAQSAPAANERSTRKPSGRSTNPQAETITSYASEGFSSAGVKLFADFDWATLVRNLTSFGTALGTATERLRGFVPTNIQDLGAQRAATPAPGISAAGVGIDGGFGERSDAGAARGIGLLANESLVRLNRKVLSSQELLKQYRTTTKTYREFIQGVAASSSEIDTSELQAALNNPDPIVQGGLDAAFENRGDILAKRNRTLLANDVKRQQTADTREGALAELRTRYPNLARALANSARSSTIPLPKDGELNIPVARGTTIRDVTLGSGAEISAKLELEQVDKALKRIYQTESGAPRIPRSFTRGDFVGEIAEAFSGSLDGTTSGFSGVPTGDGKFVRQDLSQGKTERAQRAKFTPLLLEILPRLFKEAFTGVDLTQTTGPQIVEIVKAELGKQNLTRERIDTARGELQDELDRNGGVVRAQALAKFDRLGPSLLVAQQLEKGELQPVPASLNPNRVIPFLNNLRKFEGFQSSEQSSKRIAAQLGRLPNDPEAQASYRLYSDRATAAQTGREAVEATLLDDIKNGGFGELLAADDLREPFKVREVIERLAKGTAPQEFGLPKGESIESARALKQQLSNILKVKRSLDSAIKTAKRVKGTDKIREARFNVKQLQATFASAFESLDSIAGIYEKPESIEQFDADAATLGRGTLTKGLERQLSTREATRRETALRRRRQDLEARIKGGAVASIIVNDESFSEVPRDLVNDAIGGLGTANSLLSQARRLVPKNVFNNLARGVSPSKFGSKLGTGPQQAADLIAEFRAQVLKTFDASPVLQSFGGSRPTAFQDQVKLVENVGPALRALSGVGRKLAGPRDPLPGVLFRLRNEALPESSGAGSGTAMDLVSEAEKKELAAFGYEFVEFSKQQIAAIQAARKRIRDEQAKPGQGIRQLGFLKGLETRAKLIEGLGGEFVLPGRPDFRELESFLADKSGDPIDPLAASISPLADRFLDNKTTDRTRNQQNIRDLPGLEAQREALSSKLVELQRANGLRAAGKLGGTNGRRGRNTFERAGDAIGLLAGGTSSLDLRSIESAVQQPEVTTLSKQLQGVLGRISDITTSERPPNLSRRTTQEKVSAIDTLEVTLAGLKEELATVQARGVSPRKVLEDKIAEARLGLGSNGRLIRAATDARAGLPLLGPAFNNTFAGQAAPAQRLSEASQGIADLQAFVAEQSAALKALPPDAKNLNPIDGSSPRDFYSEESLKARIRGIEDRLRTLNKKLQLDFAKSVPQQVSPAALQNAQDRAQANEQLPDFAQFPNAPRGGGSGGGGKPPTPPGGDGPTGSDGNGGGPNRGNILVQILAELKAHTVLLGGGGLRDIGEAGGQVNAVGKAFTDLASTIRASNIAISTIMRRPVQENVLGAIRTSNFLTRQEALDASAAAKIDKTFAARKDLLVFKQGLGDSRPLPIDDRALAVPREISKVALQTLLPEIKARLAGFNGAGIGVETALAALTTSSTEAQRSRGLRQLNTGLTKRDTAGELLLNTAERALESIPKAKALRGVKDTIAGVRALQADLRPELELRNEYRLAERNATRKGLSPDRRTELEAEQASIGARIPGGIVELEKTVREKRDTIQAGLGQIALAMQRVERAGSSVTRSAVIGSFANSLRTLSQYAGAGAIVFGTVSAIRTAFRELVSFEAELTRVQGILGVTSSNVRDKIQGDITAAATEYGVSIREALEAFKVFAQAGDDRTQATARTRASLAAVQGLGIAPGQAQELLISTGNITNDRVSPNAILDRISQVERTNAVTSQDLSIAIQRVGSIAQQFQPESIGGIDALDLVSGLATEIIEKTRVSGNQAATSLRFILARLASPEIATKLQNNFDIKLGGRNSGELRPLSDILQDIGAKFKELTESGQTVKAGDLLSTFAGARQINAAAALFEDFSKVLDIATESSRAFGDTQRRLALQQGTLEFQFKQLGTTLNGQFELFVRKSGLLTGLKGAVGLGTATSRGVLGAAAENPALGVVGAIATPLLAMAGFSAGAAAATAAGFGTLATGLAALASSPVLVGIAALSAAVGALALLGKGLELLNGTEGPTQQAEGILAAARARVQLVPQYKEFGDTATSLGTTRNGLLDVGLAGNRAGLGALRAKFGTDDFKVLAQLDEKSRRTVRDTFDTASVNAVRAGLGGSLQERFPEQKDQAEFARSLIRQTLVQLRAVPENIVGDFASGADARIVELEKVRELLGDQLGTRLSTRERFANTGKNAVSLSKGPLTGLEDSLGTFGTVLEAVVNTAKSADGTPLLALVQRSKSANIGQLLQFIGATILNPELTQSQQRTRTAGEALALQQPGDKPIAGSSDYYRTARLLLPLTGQSLGDQKGAAEALLQREVFARAVGNAFDETLKTGATSKSLGLVGREGSTNPANDPAAVTEEILRIANAELQTRIASLRKQGSSAELKKYEDAQKSLQSSDLAGSVKADITRLTDSPFRGFVKDRLADAVTNFALASREIRVFGAAVKEAGGTFDDLAERQAASQNFVKQLSGLDGDVFRNFAQVQGRLAQIDANRPNGTGVALPLVGEEGSPERISQLALQQAIAARNPEAGEEVSKQVESLKIQADQLFEQLDVLTGGGKNFDAFDGNTRKLVERVFALDGDVRQFFLAATAEQIKAGANATFRRDTQALAERERGITAIGVAGSLGQTTAQLEAQERARQRGLDIKLQSIGGDRFGVIGKEFGNQRAPLDDRLAQIDAAAKARLDALAPAPDGDIERARKELEIKTGAGKERLDAIAGALSTARDGVVDRRVAQAERLQGIKESVVAPFTNALAEFFSNPAALTTGSGRGGAFGALGAALAGGFQSQLGRALSDNLFGENGVLGKSLRGVLGGDPLLRGADAIRGALDDGGANFVRSLEAVLDRAAATQYGLVKGSLPGTGASLDGSVAAAALTGGGGSIPGSQFARFAAPLLTGVSMGLSDPVPGRKPKTKEEKFIAENLAAATKVGNELGIDPKILIAQGMLESNSGTQVGAPFNYGGIKAGKGYKGPTGKLVADNQLGSMSKYVAFESREAYFDYKGSQLRRNWKGALGVGSDVRAYGKALQEGGRIGPYSETGNYPDLLEGRLAEVNRLLVGLDTGMASQTTPTTPTVPATPVVSRLTSPAATLPAWKRGLFSGMDGVANVLSAGPQAALGLDNYGKTKLKWRYDANTKSNLGFLGTGDRNDLGGSAFGLYGGLGVSSSLAATTSTSSVSEDEALRLGLEQIDRMLLPNERNDSAVLTTNLGGYGKSLLGRVMPTGYSLKTGRQIEPPKSRQLGQTAQAFQQLGIFAGSSLGTAVGTRGANANSGAQLGSSLGSTAGTIAGSAAGTAIGGTLGSVVPVIGTFIGAALGGYLGKQFAPGSKDIQSDPLQRIERNTRETITAIENQTGKLLDLNNRLINVPTNFAVPSYRPSDVGGGGIQVSGGISIVVQDASNPAATAQAVYDRFRDELRTQAAFVDTRGI